MNRSPDTALSTTLLRRCQERLTDQHVQDFHTLTLHAAGGAPMDHPLFPLMVG